MYMFMSYIGFYGISFLYLLVQAVIPGDSSVVEKNENNLPMANLLIVKC